MPPPLVSCPPSSTRVTLTLGAGTGGRDFPLLNALPEKAEVPWDELGDIPTAVVTGSNGKTTTVRLLAACARAAGWHAGYNCTDGVYLDDELLLASGDYSGPAGARMVPARPTRPSSHSRNGARRHSAPRHRRVPQAQSVAVVTNVSADHFGEYGVDDLADLAATKLTVAATVRRCGLLVLNADDPLPARAKRQEIATSVWTHATARLVFSGTEQPHSLADYRARGDMTSGVSDGRLQLKHGQITHDLGAVAAHAVGHWRSGDLQHRESGGCRTGRARTRDFAGGHPQSVFARFGSRLEDNPGRMMRFERDEGHDTHRLCAQSRRTTRFSGSRQPFTPRGRPARDYPGPGR